MKKIFPNLKVAEREHFEAHQDWEVPIKGFFIIAPERKVRSFEEFTDEEAKELGVFIKDIREAMSEVLNIKDVYLFQNEDTDHDFHIWMFPRHEWMEDFGREIESVRPIMEHAKKELVSKDKKKEVREAARKVREYMKEK